MTLKTIVVDALLAGGFDGLQNANGECSCLVDDIAPCGYPNLDCTPGHRAPCVCGDHDFHVVIRDDAAPRQR